MRWWLIGALALALPAWPVSLPAQAPREKPAITVRFETPRDFGYHVGDLIPLTLAIDAEHGVIVDLESLPGPGETVGPFEVRGVRIGSFSNGARLVHRVEFTLQTFVPATSALGVVFPPLELRFALPEDRTEDGGYTYRTAALPPRVFYLSPTAVGPRVLRPLKGPVAAPAGWLFWAPLGAGALAVATGLGVLAGDLARRWRRWAADRPSPAAQRSLRALRGLRARYLRCDDKAELLFGGVSALVRRHLAAECGLPARTQTAEQIRERFRGHPLEQHIGLILRRCDEVTYEGRQPSAAERASLLQEAAALIARLERGGCPAAGGNGASG